MANSLSLGVVGIEMRRARSACDPGLFAADRSSTKPWKLWTWFEVSLIRDTGRRSHTADDFLSLSQAGCCHHQQQSLRMLLPHTRPRCMAMTATTTIDRQKQRLAVSCLCHVTFPLCWSSIMMSKVRDRMKSQRSRRKERGIFTAHVTPRIANNNNNNDDARVQARVDRVALESKTS